MSDLPTVITSAGLQPTPVTTIQQNIITEAQILSPGLTADLPGLLIEDVSSTETAGVAQMDQARVDLVNSLTPYGSNQALLLQLGNMYGVGPLGTPTSTSVNVVFTGTGACGPGFVIAQGFTVSDGTYQYTLQDGGVIGSGGSSPPLFAVAVLTGSWVVPANSVTQTVTSLPPSGALSCTNPLAGTPGSAVNETWESYRSRVIMAGKAIAQGMATFLKILLYLVPGVQQRLVSVVQINGGGWEIICGGGDPYQIAYAIYTALFDISSLQGSIMSISNITTSSNAVVTTVFNHGLLTGAGVTLSGIVGPTELNGTLYTITVIDEKNFSLNTSSLPFPAYVSGGVVSPNSRNNVVTIYDFPNTYAIPFVSPPQQTVTITLTWNSISSGSGAQNYVSPAAVAQSGAPAIQTYINGITAGQPINIFELENVFQAATIQLIPTQLLIRMIWSININGISTAPSAGTQAVFGDPESYFYCASNGVTITQG